MAARKPRVEIPRNPEELIKLLKAVTKKHDADGATSPLRDMAISTVKGQMVEAEKQHTDSEAFRKKSEECTQARDKALGLSKKAIEDGTALWHVMAMRDVLMGIFKGREQKLGEWGFSVDGSQKSKPAKNGADKAKG